MKTLLSKAIALASAKFEGKFDRGGEPYILHCLHVANQVSDLDEDARVAAVLQYR